MISTHINWIVLGKAFSKDLEFFKGVELFLQRMQFIQEFFLYLLDLNTKKMDLKK